MCDAKGPGSIRGTPSAEGLKGHPSSWTFKFLSMKLTYVELLLLSSADGTWNLQRTEVLGHADSPADFMQDNEGSSRTSSIRWRTCCTFGRRRKNPSHHSSCSFRGFFWFSELDPLPTDTACVCLMDTVQRRLVSTVEPKTKILQTGAKKMVFIFVPDCKETCM